MKEDVLELLSDLLKICTTLSHNRPVFVSHVTLTRFVQRQRLDRDPPPQLPLYLSYFEEINLRRTTLHLAFRSQEQALSLSEFVVQEVDVDSG